MANPSVTEVVEKVLQANESGVLQIPTVGVEGTNEAVLELSSLPPLNLEKRLKYLIGYPHGCLEQTTSRAYPQLFLEDLVELSEKQLREVKVHISEAISKIARMQTSRGGFSYWPGQGEDFWATSYAGSFLLDARKKGWAIPERVIQSLVKFQSKTARSWTRHTQYNDDLQQAFRLYNLALASRPELGLMNRLREDRKTSWLANWYLSTAYAVIGQLEVARNIVANLEIGDMDEASNRFSYGSVYRDQGIILEAHLAMNNNEEAFSLLRDLSNALASNIWMSTQTTAYTLKAIGKLLGTQKNITGINATTKMMEESPVQMKSKFAYQQMEIPTNTIGQPCQIDNNSQAILFARILSTGTPLEGLEKADNRGLTCQVQLLDLDGQLIDPSLPFVQGSDARVLTTISNVSGQYINEIALTQILPSGWEIINNRLNEERATTNNFEYQDVRDDRVMTYFDLNPGQKMTIEIRVNNSYAGKYYLPGTLVEAMYDTSKYARTSGRWIEIQDIMHSDL